LLTAAVASILLINLSVEVWCTGSSQAAAAAAAEFICHEKKIHVYINVKDRRAARKGSSTYYVINLYAILDFPFVIKRHQAPTPPPPPR